MLRTPERAFGLPSEHYCVVFRSVGHAPRSLVETQLKLRIVAVFIAIGSSRSSNELPPQFRKIEERNRLKADSDSAGHGI